MSQQLQNSPSLIQRLLMSLLFCMAPFSSHAAKLLNGPIPGASTMHDILIWVQTDASAEVWIEYKSTDDESEQTYRSDSYTTKREKGFAEEILLIEGLVPGGKYSFSVFVDGEKQSVPFRDGYKQSGEIPMTFQVKPNWRFQPTEDGGRHSFFDFRLAMGSCAYINEPGTDRATGKPYGGDYRIFESIYEKDPDLMLWLGDNVYYREYDFESRNGMIHRWTHDRQTPEIRALFANSIHLATWDDHDYGPNDIGASFTLKDTAKEIFDLMWPNPSSGTREIPGIFTFYNWGDVNIFMLDNRFYLSTAPGDPEAFGKEKSMLGRKQVDWLVDHLIWAQSQMWTDSKSYPARFNLICTGNQVLNNSGNSHGYRAFKKEWQYLIDRIVHEKIAGVVFLSGDVHFGEVNRLDYIGGGMPGTPGKAGIPDRSHTLLEVTSSPLTAGSWAGHKENDARYDIFDGEPDRAGQRNFVTLDFKGPSKERVMEIRYWDSDGNLLNQKEGAAEGVITDKSTIKARDLWAPRK
ncbi:MAG: alkaline phosphatase D family protein [Opitutales bacterium]